MVASGQLWRSKRNSREYTRDLLTSLARESRELCLERRDLEYLLIDLLPEILEACLEGLLADHVIGLRLALVPRHRDQGPRSHVMKSLIGYGEPLRQIRP